MRILIVGSGGREHAIGWKLAQSPRLSGLLFAPGNAGTSALGENFALHPEDIPGLRALAREKKVDLVVIGPEAPLAAGAADALREAGLAVFGPSLAAARIESSKVFAKDFMQRHGIPTARFESFTSLEPALAALRAAPYPVVIKASGLAAGKGVLLPRSLAEGEDILRAILQDRAFGAAGDTVVIEECLSGEEISLLAFTDGQTVRPLPPAQDHKRLQDGDQGPNTGGMGAYAPAPNCPPELIAELTRTILQPAVDGLRLEGSPFVGILYAGLMLTAAGPQVLEFNCRFGDPETQVLLPLLESDLLEIMLACVEGRLDQMDIRWRADSAACIVLASENYPEKSITGREIKGLDQTAPQAMIFHAGTKRLGEPVVTSGGRVLGVTAWGADLTTALDTAYALVNRIEFQGMHYRHDIGWRARQAQGTNAYAQSGVDISAGNRAVELMKSAVQATYSPQVLAGIGAFGGLWDAQSLQSLRHPVLVASTDGVGTKVKLAAAVQRYATIGQDLVNHCINDILVQGAAPLFFLDYFASAHLDPEIVAQVVGGVAGACQAAGIALLGGETAEMPGVYQPDEFDLAGTIIGVVEKEQILPRREDMQPGDLLIGLRSSGPHTNGYSLIRRLFAAEPLMEIHPALGISLADALLAPHRSYLPLLKPIIDHPAYLVKGLAHITGGGFIENIPRILPDQLGAVVHLGAFPIPPIFRLIQERGQISQAEMARVFNLGIGMVAVVALKDGLAFQQALGEECWVIGELVRGERRVTLV